MTASNVAEGVESISWFHFAVIHKLIDDCWCAQIGFQSLSMCCHLRFIDVMIQPLLLETKQKYQLLISICEGKGEGL